MPYQDRSSFEKHAGGAVAFLVSFVIHTILLIAVACWVFTAGKNSHGILLVADEGISQETGLDLASELLIEPQEISVPEEPNAPEIIPLANAPSASINLQSTFDLPKTSASGSTTESTFASIGGNLQEGVSKSLYAPMEKRGAAFFGAYAEGKRFVFVLDSSRSMLQDDRWTYACNQLIDSLNGLLPEQEFYVICFDIQTTFLFNNPPTRAKFFKSDVNTLTRVKRWLRSHELGRATMPADALQYALKLEPDAIFLLSDGEIQDNSVGMLRLINGFSSNYRQIPIHTIHLFSLEGRETLQLIARENGGTFTPVQNH